MGSLLSAIWILTIINPSLTQEHFVLLRKHHVFASLRPIFFWVGENCSFLFFLFCWISTRLCSFSQFLRWDEIWMRFEIQLSLKKVLQALPNAILTCISAGFDWNFAQISAKFENRVKFWKTKKSFSISQFLRKESSFHFDSRLSKTK